MMPKGPIAMALLIMSGIAGLFVAILILKMTLVNFDTQTDENRAKMSTMDCDFIRDGQTGVFAGECGRNIVGVLCGLQYCN